MASWNATEWDEVVEKSQLPAGPWSSAASLGVHGSSGTANGLALAHMPPLDTRPDYAEEAALPIAAISRWIEVILAPLVAPTARQALCQRVSAWAA